jgi:arylsulfatase A-like enzyme
MKKINAISPEFRRTYVAMVTRMDAGIGKVLDALIEKGIEENTLIFFLSDNGGGENVNERGAAGYPSSNEPLRGFKGMLLEGGIRVPYIVSWKGILPEGVSYDHPVTSMDIGATALALGGGAPKNMPLDGVNIIPYLAGKKKTEPHDRLYWKLWSRGAIREGRYKLITAEENPKYELYDLEADLTESLNIADENPELVKRLDKLWKKWNAEMMPPLWVTPPRSEWTKPEYQPVHPVIEP